MNLNSRVPSSPASHAPKYRTNALEISIYWKSIVCVPLCRPAMHPQVRHFAVILPALLASAALPAFAAYCMPTDICWPAASEWAALNASISGRLISVQPEGEPCALYGVNDPRCQAVLNNWSDPYWRFALRVSPPLVHLGRCPHRTRAYLLFFLTILSKRC